jgi:elongation factor 1 alpha-like protein
VIVAVNKMDRTNPSPWSEARFQVVEEVVKEMLVGLSFKPERISFVPVSGLTGDNLTIKHGMPAVSWYSGGTLLDAMESVTPRNPSSSSSSSGDVISLRAVVTGVVSDSSGKGFEVSVTVLRGRLRVNRRVGVPLGHSVVICTVKKMIRHQSGESADISSVGEHVTLTLVETSSTGRSADELGIREGTCLYKGPPALQRVTRFHATIKTSTQLEVPILPGTRCEMYIHSFEVSV